MRKSTLALVSSAVLLLACSKPEETTQKAPVAAGAAHVNWVTPEGANMDKIFADAQASNTPVFLYWGAVWCPPCNQVKATVFNRKDFVERSRQMVAVYLDGDTPGAQKLGAQFKVMGYPTMLLLKPDRSEITRMPGEVDPVRYVEVLDQALASTGTVKENLAAALSPDPGKASAQAWRQLAYYSWDQDQAQLVPTPERAATLGKLAAACPKDQPALAARFALKSILASAQSKTPVADPAAATAQLLAVLADRGMAKETFDILSGSANSFVEALTAKGTAERAALVKALDTALERLSADIALPSADRLGAVYTKLMLAKQQAATPADYKADAAMQTLVRDAVNQANKASTSKYERQAVIPSAADLLTQAGLVEDSDAMLQAELPKAISPYYHMLVLASNANKRGDKSASLEWAEKAWTTSQGPATRLQWGVGYVSRIIDLTPDDSARVEKAAAGVLAEVEASPDFFYERNRRGLERLGSKLNTWNAKGNNSAALARLSKQMDATCAKLPGQSEAKEACSGVFKPRVTPKA